MSEEYRITSLLTLGEIAVVSNVNEKRILLQLCIYAKVASHKLVEHIVLHIAESLSYSSIRIFFEYHIEFLWDEWISSDSSLEDFPFYLCETDSLSSFFQRYIGTVLPLIVLRKKETILEQAAEALETTPNDLIRLRSILFSCQGTF